MNIPDALYELGAQIGLPDLALDGNGLCRVVFDDTLTVDFQASDDDTLHFFAVVAHVESAPRHAELYEMLLQAHFLGAATGGAIFSLDESTGEVLFERTLDMRALDFTGFFKVVESFVNHYEGWLERIKHALGSESPANGSPVPVTAPDFSMRA